MKNPKKKSKAMGIEEISVNLIKPYWRNARDNTQTIKPLKESIRRYGFNQPIVIDGENTIIVGHARLKAAIELGIKKVPCITLDISVEKANEYRILDNKVSEFTIWELDALKQELKTLPLENLESFFPLLDLSTFLTPPSTPVTKEDIDNKNGELQDRERNAYELRLKENITLTCPHCGEEYVVTKHDILKTEG